MSEKETVKNEYCDWAGINCYKIKEGELPPTADLDCVCCILGEIRDDVAYLIEINKEVKT